MINTKIVYKNIAALIYTSVIIIIFMMIVPTIVINTGVTKDVEQSENVSAEMNDSSMENQNNIENKNILLNSSETVKVYITESGIIEEVPLEEYICGVVSNEMPASFESEALKAQAIAARTYLSSKKIKNCPQAQGAEICDSTHCQVYTSREKRLEKWDSEAAESNWNKIKAAVDDTAGQVLAYNGELVLYPQFFSTSSGYTENSEDAYWGDIPYLKSVASTGEESAPKYNSEKSMTIEQFINKVKGSYPNIDIDASNIESKMKVTSRSEAGGVITIDIDGTSIKGTDFRFLVGLNSTNFTYTIDANNITFQGKGYGHGVGMSQWGANAMAKAGKNYDEILKHYYTGVEIKNLQFTN